MRVIDVSTWSAARKAWCRWTLERRNQFLGGFGFALGWAVHEWTALPREIRAQVEMQEGTHTWAISGGNFVPGNN